MACNSEALCETSQMRSTKGAAVSFLNEKKKNFDERLSISVEL